MNDGLMGGFADPVLDAQRCFRAILDAMSRPGLIRAVAGLHPPAPLCPAAAAALLALVDHETPLWLDPIAARARDWVAFHTGAPPARRIEDAAFVMALALPTLSTLNLGGHETPEASTTVILQVASLSQGPGYRLAGPGLAQPRILSVDGLPGDFVTQWQANRRLFPRGVDVILCADDHITALPRTVTIEEA